LVVSHLLTVLLVAKLKLSEKLTMYNTLIDPPYAFPPLRKPTLVVIALQLVQGASWMLTLKLLAVVAPQLLLVLLL
jgi:hypothetical protein